MTFIPQRARDLTERKLLLAAGLDSRATDMNPGSVLRTIFEAVSICEEELDHRMFQGVIEGIAEELYSAFDFARLPAVPASGVVRFVRDATQGVFEVTIPAGTVVAAPATTRRPQVSYVTLASVVIEESAADVDVLVRATTTGTDGNVAAGAINILVSTINGLGTVTNQSAILNGLDEETDGARLTRFAQWVSELRSSTLAGLEAQARRIVITDSAGHAIERVDYAHAVDSYIAGRTDLYIDNGGGDASTDLIAAVQSALDGGYTEAGDRVPGYKASGIVLRVFGSRGVPVAVTATLVLEPGYLAANVIAAVSDAVTRYIYGLRRDRSLIWADLLTTIVQVEGVLDATLTTPSMNRAPAFEERLLPGVLTFTV